MRNRTPGPRIAASRFDRPKNLVPVYIGSAPGRALVDSGATRSMMSGDMYRRIQRKGYKIEHVTTEQIPKLILADKSPMPAQALIDIDIKIGGVTCPFVFIVVETLDYDCLLGMDFMNDTEALLDIKHSTLHLFGGLTSVPMTVTGNHAVVATIANVTIPPFSEAVIAVRPNRRVGSGNFIIEGQAKSPCASLMVARSLVDTANSKLPCRVLNPTDKPIMLKRKAPVGVLAPVNAITQSNINKPVQQTVSLVEMKRALDAKKISFEGTAMQGKDLEALIKLLYNNIDLFATSLSEMPGTDVMLHRIDTGNSPPIRKRAYRHAPADKIEIAKQVEEMAKAGIIEESDTPWSSPVLLVSKKDGSKRFCVDFRHLNEVTTLTSWPLPTLDEVLDVVGEQKPTLWSSIDLRSGYWQVALDPATKDRTGFQAADANWVFNRVAMGLSGAVQFFQMIMQKVLKSLTPSAVIIYLDDVLVLSDGPQQMLERLGAVFDRFRESNLRMHPTKCHWGQERIKFLGHYFDKNGISTDPDKIKIVKEFPTPRTQKQVRSFLGLANYYRRFVQNFSTITQPLRELLKIDVAFKWTANCQDAFEKLKTALTTAPVLVLARFDKPFVLTTDASVTGIAYILSQRDDNNKEQVVCYGGRGVRPAESRWTITELECLAVIEGIRQFHTFLAGNEFEIVTDHVSLTFLNKMKLASNNRLTRWALFLQPYKFKITYKKGIHMTSADALSRIPRHTNPQEEEVSEDQDDGEIFAVRENENITEEHRIKLEFQPTNAVREETLNLPSIGDVKSEQTCCEEFSAMHQYLTSNKLPENEETARRIVLESQNYVLQDGILYHLFTPRTKKVDRAFSVIKQLCVPSKFHKDIAIGLHDCNGHVGGDRLYATARVRYYWSGMYTFLHNHVATCLKCQMGKNPAHPTKSPIGALPTAAPGERWIIDHHGPYVASGNGMRYVLVIIDSASMWPELIATADTSAETVVQALFDNVVSRYGFPREISLQSDNGSGFIAKLTQLFCKTFGVKQYFSTPYHPQPQAKVEGFAKTIHNSLRILCDKQSDWTKHLQAIAMSYRGTATTSIGMSPHEVMYARPFRFAIDWSLMGPDTPGSTPQAYAAEIKPKLEILSFLAQENSRENAERHRIKANTEATLPTYKVGDKVLLHNPVTKKGDSAKLTVRYSPFLITDSDARFNYFLQDLTTGKALKRPVHCSRLRPLKELDNDYRISAPDQQSSLYSGVTSVRQLNMQVVVGDPLTHATGAVITYTDDQLTALDGVSRTVHEAGGVSLREECLDHIKQQTPLSAVITSAGDIVAAQHVAHIVLKHDETLDNQLVEMLRVIDASTNVSTVVIPFPGIDTPDNQLWTIAGLHAKALKQFEADTLLNIGSLRDVIFTNLSLLTADVLSVVLRQAFQVIEPEEEKPPDVSTEVESTDKEVDVVPNDEALTTEPHDEHNGWYTIERILKQRKHKNKMQYLVKWEGYDATQWCDRAHVTDYAVQRYLADKKSRKRKKRK